MLQAKKMLFVLLGYRFELSPSPAVETWGRFSLLTVFGGKIIGHPVQNLEICFGSITDPFHILFKDTDVC